MAFNGQEITKSSYRSALARPQSFAVRQGVVSGLTMGTIYGKLMVATAQHPEPKSCQQVRLESSILPVYHTRCSAHPAPRSESSLDLLQASCT